MFGRRKKRGFTFVETLLTVVIISVIASIVAKILLVGLDSYALIVNRHDALQTARLAMERMVDEIVMFESSDIYGIYNTRLNFNDVYDDSTNFRKTNATMGGQSVPCIYRKGDFLAGNVTLLDFDYYRDNGSATTLPSRVRRINVDFTVQAGAGAGTVHVRTDVFPRAFMYDNFE